MQALADGAGSIFRGSAYMYRQGDVLLVPVDASAVPPSAVPVPPDASGRHLLARGEATGHAHRLAGPRVRLLTAPDDASAVFVEVPERARLVHEEHGLITVPGGWYQVVRQREYVPGSYRPVAD
jgi:hypothetical protein